MGTTRAGGSGNGVDSRQLALVVVCVFGLLAAAFLAPVAGANGLLSQGDATSSGGGGGAGQDGASGGGGSESGGEGGGGESGGVYTPGGDRPGGREVDVDRRRGCHVVVEGDPRPGADTTVTVTVDGEPTPDVPVWFNGELVGRTNLAGLVSGTVPYVTELNVTVESPIGEPCTFSERGAVRESGAGLVGAAAMATGGGTAAALPGSGVPLGQEGTPQAGVNNSSVYAVADRVVIRVTGERYPGSNATVVATVAGVPMADAAVTVDGDRVGRTDPDGRVRVRVPDTDSVTVGVSRGEISGQRTVDVWDLSVGFASGLVVPGERATVNVTRNGSPVENASVSLDGGTLGTTGADGRLGFALPTTADGTVRATTARQSATVPLWRAYALTAGLTLLLVLSGTATTGLTAHWRDRAAARRVAAFWVAIAALFVGFAVGELVGLAAVAGCLLLVAGYRYRRGVRSGGATLAELLVAFLEWCKRLVLGVVGLLESAVDWLHSGAVRLWAWFRTLPTSLSGLARRLGAWLRTLPGRLLATLRSLPIRGLAAGGLALGLVGAATYVFGVRGFVGSAGLVVVAAAIWFLSKRGATATSESGEESTTQTGGATTSSDESGTTLRQLWRRLAGWALPSTWRTRTPTEISRAAVEKGLPEAPVEALAEAFRDVEYGGQPEESRREQARSAFDRLEYARGGDEGDEER